VTDRSIRAVFWDFGGVILTSPFEAFNEYEATHDIPADFIRSVNAVDPHTNAWARIERREITPAEFDVAFAEESARLGHRIRGADVLALLGGAIRPEMVVALDRVIEAGYIAACLTNNVAGDTAATGNTTRTVDDVASVMARFHHVVESSKVGCRKPERAFYEQACALAAVDPTAVVFLDDLGINLKPAREMGMTTIKVIGADQAIADLESVLGVGLR
jgi:putative hydrolase of the HAD superfamily